MYQFVRILMSILQFWELYAILYYLNFHNGLGLNFKINLFEATFSISERKILRILETVFRSDGASEGCEESDERTATD